jgi:signal transduction histidine kinase
MRLADFILPNREKIVAEWEAFARTLLPAGERASKSSLRDHADQILEAIVVDIKSPQTAEEQSAKSKGQGEDLGVGGAGEIHAGLRIETGFRLDQVVAEFRALRASVLRLWKECPEAMDGDIDGVTRFNEAIDEALTDSARRYVEMLEHRRDQFLGVLGHDLRNPLNALATGASFLVDSEGLDDESARVASRMLNSATRMDRMVGDLLDLTRTSLGPGIPVVLAPMDLAPVCRQVVAELNGGHPHELLQFESKGDLHGEWDSDRLAQVLSNLVGNALQHGNKKAPVSLVARDDGDEVVLEVHNEGPPIPEAALSTVFDPLVRQSSEDDKTPGSLGLGLYIAEQVVVAHGGTIAVTSTQADGTTFAVHLPRRPTAARRANANQTA